MMSDIFLGFQDVRTAMDAPTEEERSSKIKKLKEELGQLFDQERRSGGVSFSNDDPFRADVRPDGILNDFTAQFEALLKVLYVYFTRKCIRSGFTRKVSFLP